jgi:hypothetical protein
MEQEHCADSHFFDGLTLTESRESGTIGHEARKRDRERKKSKKKKAQEEFAA